MPAKVKLTDGQKQAMRDAANRLRGVPFSETPGQKATYPTTNDQGDFVDRPIVVVDHVDGRPIARFHDLAVSLLSVNFPIDYVSGEEFDAALRNI